MRKFIATLALLLTLTGCTTATEATTEAPASMDSYAATAWEAFDASGGAEFIPAEGGRVDLIGVNSTGFPNADESMITIAGPDGLWFLFKVSQ